MIAKSRNFIVIAMTLGMILTVSFTTSALLNQRIAAIAVCEPNPQTGEISCNCPEGQHEQGGTCVPDEIHCSSGTILQGNECKPITDEFKNQGQCIKDSRTQGSEVTKDTCKSAFKDKNS
jgi:hypothetical protein